MSVLPGTTTGSRATKEARKTKKPSEKDNRNGIMGIEQRWFLKETRAVVTVEHEPMEISVEPYEHCCKCERETAYWYTPKDVPLCRECAVGLEDADIPTKAQWFAL